MNPKGGKTAATYCDWDLIHQIIGDLMGKGKYYWALLFTVGIYTGLRIADIRKIKWTDLLGKEVYTLHEQKTGKHREVLLHPVLQNTVKICYRRMKPKNITHLMFGMVTNPKKVMDHSRMAKGLKKIFADYPQHTGNVSTHMFRKTFGRRIWDKNGQSDSALIMLCEMFNHKEVSTTRRYLGIRQEELQNLYKSL